ncbi:MAG: ABC transporter permease [Planctomycetes bacterium]|nr:ABC transporter permease [Planctomycetota bacterium]
MYRPFLATRYLLARPVSWLAMVSIGIGVAALITVVSVMNGFLRDTMAFVRGTTADVLVLPAQGAGGGRSASREDFERVVRGHPDVAAVCSRLVRPAVVKVHGAANVYLNDTQAGDVNFVNVLGIEPADEAAHSDLLKYLRQVERPHLRVRELAEADAATPPRAPDPARLFLLDRKSIRDRSLANADLPRILIGEDRMAGLGLSPGDAVELVTLPDDVDFGQQSLASRTETFVIAGAFRSGKYEFDMQSMYVTREAFRAWTATRQELSEMAVTARDPQELDALRDRLAGSLRAAGLDAAVMTWKDRHRIYLSAVEVERNILTIVLAFFVLLTCTLTFSMLTMMVQEKVRDIGILSALGAPSLGVGAVFATCGLFVAGAGGALGFVLGELMARNVDPIKDWIRDVTGIEIFPSNVYAFKTLPSEVNTPLDAAIVLATVVFAGFICLVPAWRAARLDPVECLRHE